jgi:hypothetical protein
MTRRAILGLGDHPNLRVLQGADSARLPMPPGARGLALSSDWRLTIRPVNRLRGVAPVCVHFRGEIAGPGLPARPEHDLQWFWTFGEAGPQPWPRLRSEAFDLLGWNDGNFSLTKGRTSHLFATGGRRTVRCEVTDGVSYAVDEYVIDVDDPDAYFAADGTILVAPDGDFTGGPAGALTAWGGSPIATVGAALGAWRDLGRNRRILLKRGGTYDTFGVIEGAVKLHVGAWGAGARPVIPTIDGTSLMGLNDQTDGYEIMVSGFRMQGDWDPTTETGTKRGDDGITAQNMALARRGRITIYDVEGANQNGRSFGAPSDTRVQADSEMAVVSCSARDWRDYGLFLGAVRWFSSLGNRIAQHPLALGGGNRAEGNAHGPFRCAAPPPADEGALIVDCCEMVSRNGWSGSPGNALGPSHQSVMRLNTKGKKDACMRISRIVGEGGAVVVVNSTQQSDSPRTRQDAVFNGIVMIMGGSTAGGLAIGHSGTTAENVLGIVPPGPSHHGNPDGGLCGLSDPTDKNVSTRVDVENDVAEGKLTPADRDERFDAIEAWGDGHFTTRNLSLVNLRAPAQNGGTPRPGPISEMSADDALAGGVSITNLLYHAPFEGDPALDLSAALDLTRQTATPGYRGLRYHDGAAVVSDTQYATPAAMVSIAAAPGDAIVPVWPGAGSYAVDDARFTVDAQGMLRRSAAGALADGETVQLTVTVDGDPRGVNLLAHDGPTRIGTPLPLPTGPGALPAEAGHAVDDITGRLRPVGAASRGAVEVGAIDGQ